MRNFIFDIQFLDLVDYLLILEITKQLSLR